MQAAVDAYHELATGNAVADYSFHVIVTDPSEEQMHVELPKLVADGITSVKIYSTYPALQLSDSQIMDCLFAARKYGVTVSASLYSFRVRQCRDLNVCPVLLALLTIRHSGLRR